MMVAVVAWVAVFAVAPPPAPSPVPPALPNPLVGVWEPVQRSMGGLGSVIEFTPDGRFIRTMGAIVDSHYRVDGDRLFLREKETGPEDTKLIRRFTVDGGTLTFTPAGSDERRQRVGAPVPGAPPIVGIWRYDYNGGPQQAYERYSPDSRLEFRLPMASDTGRYRIDKGAIVFAPARGPENTLEFEIRGDRLLLREQGRPQQNELRRIGETSWYDRDVNNVAARRARDPKVRLQKADDALAKATTPDARWWALPDAALLNAQFGPPERATALANELLEAAAHRAGDDNVGTATHKGNLALGLVAVRAGRIDEAKGRLLAAGKVSGGGTLDSFGPNMGLAKALLEKDEREAVINYFDLCRKFWKMDRGQLDRWTKEVRAGLTPNFGPNLNY